MGSILRSGLGLAHRHSSGHVTEKSLLPRPGLKAPHPCPSPFPTLEPCTLLQGPIPEPEKQFQVCQSSGDGHLNTKRCLLFITSLLVTSLPS